MQIHINRSIATLLIAAGLTALAAGCATNKEAQEGKEDASGRVTMAQLTAPARTAVEGLIAGGKIEKIDKEMEKGKEVYDVEATVNGKHMEYTIATDGTIVGTETGIEFNELPEAVQKAAETYFGGTTGLEPARVEEDNKVAYEIEGKKNGKKVAVTFDADGKLVGEEK
jgi:uncharacterized membrane protein YkoI